MSAAATPTRLERMRRMDPKADPVGILGLEPEQVPRHVAFIMDGNGRWATERGLDRSAGHVAGAARVEELVRACSRLGIEAVTIYSFSSENWRRPAAEVDGLMSLAIEYCHRLSDWLVAERVRVRIIGRREGIPEQTLKAMDEVVERTRACGGITLQVAMNYGSRAEITDAVRSIAGRVARGELDGDGVDESVVEAHLATAGVADPDLLVRTGGEMRLSNFLLWQLSYAELYVTAVLWPDFSVPELHEAVREFARRGRRFGGLDAEPTPAGTPPGG